MNTTAKQPASEPPLPMSNWDPDIRVMIGYYVEIKGQVIAGPYAAYQDGHRKAINARRRIIYRENKLRAARRAWEAEQRKK